MKTWLIQHWQAFTFTLKQLLRTPFTSLLSIVVIGITFSLPVGVYTLLENLQSYSGKMVETPELSVFLKLDVTKTEEEEIRRRLEMQELIKSFQFIPKDYALKQLAQDNEMAMVVDNIGHNPLPDAFIVTTRRARAEELDQLRTNLQEWPGIEYVQFDTDWAKRVDALLNLGRLAVVILTTLLSIALIVVIFNTIRLQILTKREEIEVSKLIGATDSFIQRPFLYFGTIQGLAGGMMAWLIMVLGIQLMNDELAVLAELYATDFHLKHLDFEDSISLLAFSAWLGWLGARLSVASYLWRIEPK
ncbi:MAG: permease-like cell division protein FtsX [Nitrosomonas sp.]|nr:permease-like cell division protein FtsX [Nitrosomonas sp.]MDP1950715.1 permease-like cell division protein FtsX [Nitrosomonas sp.]